MADKSKINPQQIAVQKTNKTLVEALDHLQLARSAEHEPYASMHGRYSRICLKMCDYCDKENTQTMTHNIDPHLADYLITMFPLCISTFADRGFKWSESKMLQHRKNEDGTVLVTKLDINRQHKDNKGQMRKYPWFISVENGNGNPKAGPNGTSVFTNYKRERSAVIALSDPDFFLFLKKITDYVRVWEDSFCPGLIRRETQRLLDEREAGNFLPAA